MASEMNINVIIGSTNFTATIDDTETGRAFYNMLPLTLDMTELNGNEKYCYLGTSLPTASYRPGTINAGDIMLYGSSCIVVFYETFTSGYSYTPIGTIDDVDNLKAALGTGDVQVTFGHIHSELIVGDVNRDEVIDGNDLNMLINIILGKEPVIVSANVDGEGGIDGNDLNALINILLGKG